MFCVSLCDCSIVHDVSICCWNVQVVGAHLFSASADGTIRVYSTESGVLMDTLRYHRNRVTSLEASDMEKNSKSGVMIFL